MIEEPLVQSRVLGTISQREIETTGKKSSSMLTRQSFDSVFPQGRYEGDLLNLHKTHILLRIQGDSNSLYNKIYKVIDLSDCTVKALKIVTSRHFGSLSLKRFKTISSRSYHFGKTIQYGGECT